MKAVIEWFARNGVAANVLMFAVIAGGIFSLTSRVRYEVWPEFESNEISIRMTYRGATPLEVEEGVVVKIEEAIQDLEGIVEINSIAAEGTGSVLVEVEKGYDPRELLDDIKNRVDAINTFSPETEKPTFTVGRRGGRAVTVIISGDLTEHELKRLGQQVRDEITNLPGITQAALKSVRPYEIAVEISEADLRRYGLTFDQVARAIRDSSLDLPAGGIKTRGGEVLLRSRGQAYHGVDFEQIILLTHGDGTRITLADVAAVLDGFEETPLSTRFNGRPGVAVDVYRIGDQNVLDLSEAVAGYVAEASARLPAGVSLSVWSDRSNIIRSRLDTLANSALWGGFFVFVLLTLFLRFSLACWVCLGIPIAMLGALALMPEFGISINIISLFAFILVLGIIVDDAIVTGENVFSHMRRGGKSSLQCAIDGTKEVAIPVTFGILTTMVAFTPMMMIQGRRGQIWGQIAEVVIFVLAFSLVESKLILPAHLKHCKVGAGRSRSRNPLVVVQRAFADGLERFVVAVYQPVLAALSRYRYATICAFVAVFLGILGLVGGGHVPWVGFPRVPSERVRVNLTMPLGTPAEITAGHMARIEREALSLQAELEAQYGEVIIENVVATTGGNPFGSWGGGEDVAGQSHLGELVLEMSNPEERTEEQSSFAISAMLRERVGDVPGAKELGFDARIGMGGSPVHVALHSPRFEDLAAMSDQIKARLEEYSILYGITDDFSPGKQEIVLTIKPQGQHLGLSLADLARQVRQAFYGEEAQRIQRGRDDVRVLVRYTGEERRSLASLEEMRIRTPAGDEVPFAEVAEARMGRGYASIRRVDRNRTLAVLADAKEGESLEAVYADLENNVLDPIVAAHPAASWAFDGKLKEERESGGDLRTGMVVVLLAIYALMAIAFRSYLQPLIVMSVIPFSMVGAVLGHLVMGHSLSMLSAFGMIALMGVVINDSIVLVDYVNRRRAEGVPVLDAVRVSGVARFRPILLTSLTTFFGLVPLYFEKSTQAQFLIPMAISLGFGILFATAITLVLVPINYLVLDDMKRATRWYLGLGPAAGEGTGGVAAAGGAGSAEAAEAAPGPPGAASGSSV